LAERRGFLVYRFRPRHPVATAFAIWSIGAVPVLALVPPLSLCLMPAGQALAGPLVGRLGVRGTLILAAALMSVPNVCVLAFVREVRRVRRRDAPDPAPA